MVRIEREVLSENTVLPSPDRTGLEPEQRDEVPSRTEATTTHYCYDEFERLTFSKGVRAVLGFRARLLKPTRSAQPPQYHSVSAMSEPKIRFVP